MRTVQNSKGPSGPKIQTLEEKTRAQDLEKGKKGFGGD